MPEWLACLLMQPCAPSEPRPCVLLQRALLAVAACLSFINPFSNQSFMLVMGPGGYSFKDYVRLGTPAVLATVTSVPKPGCDADCDGQYDDDAAQKVGRIISAIRASMRLVCVVI